MIFSLTCVIPIQNKWQNCYFIHSNQRWDSSVSIATGYELNFLVSIPGSARFFSPPYNQIDSRVHPPSYPTGNGGTFLGEGRSRGA
jgi:hypothetical protein